MASLELVVAIGLAVLVVTAVARRVHVPPPAPLLVAVILLGLVPALGETHLPPEAVLLLFLPILLYWESFTSSWREIRSNARVVVLLSTVLVVLTAALVAAAAHALGMYGARRGSSAPRSPPPTPPPPAGPRAARPAGPARAAERLPARGGGRGVRRPRRGGQLVRG